MLMRDKATGDTVFMRYPHAHNAFRAGTHEFVGSSDGAPEFVEPAGVSVVDAVAVGGSTPSAVGSEAASIVEMGLAAMASPVDLDDMTKDELIEEADRRGVDVSSSWRKAEILEALKKAV